MNDEGVRKGHPLTFLPDNQNENDFHPHFLFRISNNQFLSSEVMNGGE